MLLFFDGLFIYLTVIEGDGFSVDKAA